jgi:hypothetical protein
MWSPAEHSDEDNLRWCWLRAVEWGCLPAFLSQVFAPVLLVFFSWQTVVLGIIVANSIWSLVRYRFVSVAFASFAAQAVFLLKWPIALSAGIYLFTQDQKFAAALALLWPLIVGFLGIPPAQVGELQNLFMSKLGYKRAEAKGDGA